MVGRSRDAAAIRIPLILVILVLSGGQTLAAADERFTTESIGFFEREIRPVLVATCLECHGEQAAKGGLRLTTRPDLLRGGNGGPALVPGRPEASLMLQTMRHLGDIRMPRNRPQLTAAQIAAFTRWILDGAAWPPDQILRAPDGFRIREEDRKFWSFQAVSDRQAPPVRDGTWARDDLDRFLLAAMQAKGLEPRPETDRRTLLRRLTYDLTGLPPSVEELDAFRGDSSPQAYAAAVDRLLASPHFGVHWARCWLDLVRYRCNAKTGDTWLFRDWVVQSLNEDRPIDRFLRDQIAGDLQPPSADGFGLAGAIATAPFALGSTHEPKAQADNAMRAEIVDEQIDLLGSTFLGLSLSCARCHDHKFDPISQQDYYALAGMFYSSHWQTTRVGPRPTIERLASLEADLAATETTFAEMKKKLVNEVRLIDLEARLATARAGMESKAIAEAETAIGRLTKDKEKNPAGWAATPEEGAALRNLSARRAQLKAGIATLGTLPSLSTMHDGGVEKTRYPGIQDAHLLIKGELERLADPVPRRLPTLFSTGAPSTSLAGSGRRTLAEWVASRDNPLTARVFVNRVWQLLFVHGLVRTPTNFGASGERPSHPELLDHLAAGFMSSGWSLKALVRRLALSAAYRQSSTPGAAQLEQDADNVLLTRAPRKRLTAEQIRDTLLVLRNGKPAVLTAPLADSGRALYFAAIKGGPGDQFAEWFDGANPMTIQARRDQSTTAIQALLLMNDPLVIETAEAVARRTLAADSQDACTTQLFREILGREPNAAELRLAGSLRERTGKEDGAPILLAHLLLCANELIHLD